MVHDVLPSDVDFARGMINSSHSDAEILAYLASRGIEAEKASRLVDDLRHGRTPSSRLPFPTDGGASPPIRKPQAVAVAAPKSWDPPRPRLLRRLHRRKGGAWWFLILLIIFAWAFGYAFLHLGSDASRDAIQKVRHEVPPPPGK